MYIQRCLLFLSLIDWKSPLKSDYSIKDLGLFTKENKPAIVRTTDSEFKELGPVKVNFTFYICLTKEGVKGTERIKHYFRHDNPFPVTYLNQAEINKQIDGIVNSVFKNVERWVQKGSGWVIERIERVHLDFSRAQFIKGGGYISLPLALRNKQAIINIKNKDDQCLRWALRAALFPTQDTKHSDRPSKYPINDGLDFSGISFPTPLNEISKVETKNYLAINIFGWAGNRVIVRRISPIENANTQRINLMLITQDKQSHYWSHS